MNDIEKMLNTFEYIKNPNKATEDVKEFIDTFERFGDLLKNNDKLIYEMDPLDVVELVVTLKNFSDAMKPFIIKYGILPNLGEAKKE